MTEFADVTQKTALDGTELILGATDAAQAVAQKYSTLDAYCSGRSFAQGAISLQDYITGSPDKATDYSAELQQAHDDAIAVGGWVYVPPGEYGIGATVNLKAPMSGEVASRCIIPYAGSIYDQAATTMFRPLMEDGSAMFKAVKLRCTYLGNFTIHFEAGGTSTTRNAVGIDWGYGRNLGGDIADYAVTSSVMENVYIFGLSTALKVSGWLNTIRDLLIVRCNQGVEGYWNSDTNWDVLRVEQANQGFNFHTGNANFFSLLTEEGGAATTSSAITGMVATVIACYRTEERDKAAVPWLTVKDSYGFKILGGYCYTTLEPGFAIDLQNVWDYEINCYFRANEGQSRRTIKTDTNCKGSRGVQLSYNLMAQESDARTAISPRLNYFPNTYMQGIKFPFDITVSNASMTEETTLGNTWGGTKALRITAGATAAPSYIMMTLKNTDILELVDDRWIGVGAWIFIPDIPAFAESGEAVPGTKVASGSAETKTGESPADGHASGQWNLFPAYVRTAATPDEYRIYFYVNTLSAASSGSYIIIGNVVMYDGVGDVDMQRGNWVDSPISGSRYVGTKNIEFTLTMAETVAAKAATYNRWDIGDKLVYTDPAAGGNIGEVCTTAGTGAAAVWKTYGSIGA